MTSAPRILITGSHGFVGCRAMERFPFAIPVPAPLVRDPGRPLADLIRLHRPDVILNTAAISDIGACDQAPEDSYLANVLLPVELAGVAAEIGAKLVSFSSDQVYTGCSGPGPYAEDLPLPEPANLYARHKLEAEQRVLELHPDAVLLRATWMYDMPLYGQANRGNFLVNTMGAVLQGRPIPVSSLQYRGITYVRQVVNFLPQVFHLPGGVYNYGSENSMNMLETTRELLKALRLEGRVEDTRQQRHNLWMDCSKLKEQGICFDTTSLGFKTCVKDYGLRW